MAYFGEALGELEELEALGRLDARAPLLERVDHRVGELLEHLALGRAQLARPAIDDAERAEAAGLRAERRAGVEADVGRPLDEGVVDEAGVEGRVPHLEEGPVPDRVLAEGVLARRLGGVEADPGLEPLALGVDQGNGRDRRLHEPRREPGQPIEGGLRRRVEHRHVPQGGQPPRLARSAHRTRSPPETLTQARGLASAREAVSEPACGASTRFGSTLASCRRPSTARFRGRPAVRVDLGLRPGGPYSKTVCVSGSFVR